MSRNVICTFMVILLAAIALAACQGKFFTARGKMVAEEKRIALPAQGSASASWQGKSDLTINYTATRSQAELQMAGEVVFHKHNKLNDFRLSLVLIDAGGSVLEVLPVTAGGGRQEAEQLPFNRGLTLPPGSTYYTFTYDGTSSGTGQSGSPTYFWSTPW